MSKYKKRFPKPGQVLIVKITKVMPYGAFGRFLDYEDVEAFLHVREVSSKWIKNIKEYVRQNQIIVAKVISVDKNKSIADISLRRVSEDERRKVWEAYENERKAKNLVRAALKKCGKEDKYEDVLSKILDVYETAYDFILDVYDNEEEAFSDVELDEDVRKELKDVVSRALKPQPVEIKKKVKVVVYGGDGIDKIKELFLKLVEMGIKVSYLGAPYYLISYTSEDRKEVVKQIMKAEKFISKYMSDLDGEYEIIEVEE